MSHWHLQPTRLTARLFASDEGQGGFGAREEPIASVQIDLHCDGGAYLHAAMRRGEPGTPRDWRELVRCIRRAYSVTHVDYEHKRADSNHDLDRLTEPMPSSGS